MKNIKVSKIIEPISASDGAGAVSYTHLRAHETDS